MPVNSHKIHFLLVGDCLRDQRGTNAVGRADLPPARNSSKVCTALWSVLPSPDGQSTEYAARGCLQMRERPLNVY